jgi:arylsulfatase A-like enzyme
MSKPRVKAVIGAKGLAWLLLGLVLAGAATYQALGGRIGVMLLMVKLFVRTEAAPTQPITWQTGPATATATATTAATTAVADPNPNPNTNTGVAKRPPNVVLILVDDLGINDITLRGGGLAGGRVPTPNIDRIAREGVDFSSGYAGNATCAPSRAAIMTGRSATRFGFEFTPTPKRFMKVVTGMAPADQLHKPVYHAEREAELIAYEDMGLPTSEITLARLLQGVGYHTVHLGKWHLGDSPAFRAYNHGFNESLSHLHGGSMFLPTQHPGVVNAMQDFDPIDRFLWAAEPWAVRFNDGTPFKPPGYMTDYLTDEAVKVLAANRHRPFFMYLAYNAPHTPLQATREDYDALAFIPDHTLRVYAAMVRSLDRNIGRVLTALKDQGLDDNTLVIFTSDNGGAHYLGLQGLNAPFRGWKATFFEGGIRVPFFMRWPGTLPAGLQVPAPVSHVDIFTTAAAAAGAAPPADRPMDGVNLLPHALGRAGERPHQRLYWRTDDYLALRDGDWKLQVAQRPQKTWLFNLAADPTEKSDLAAREPERVAALKAQLAQWNQQQRKPLWPSLGAAAIPIDQTLKQPLRPGDEYVYYAN